MKKILFALIILGLFFGVVGAENYSITGESVSGEVIVQEFSLSIPVGIAKPYLNILSPVNGTYFSDNISLQYRTLNSEGLWYNLNGGENLSVSDYISLSFGEYVLNLFSNNSIGLSHEQVYFTVDTAVLDIDYSSWNDVGKNSTKFNFYTFEEIGNLENIEFFSDGVGKILFLEGINVTDDLNNSDNFVDLDTNINISFNRIELNSTVLPNFNKEAKLWFYGLDFIEPVILKDGTACLDCTILSYEAGILEFLVDSFSVYTSVEGFSEETLSSGGGSGGGGILKEIISDFDDEDFSIDTDNFKIFLKQGQTIKKSFVVKNEYDSVVNFSIGESFVGNYLKLSETSFSLEAGQSKEIFVDFFAREDLDPNLYLGDILISGEGFIKKIKVIFEVESKRSLFDIGINLPRQFLVISPGEDLFFDVQMFNLGEIKRVDVLLEYSIINELGEVVLFEEESIAVETQANRAKIIYIPETFPEGKYVIYTRLNYDDAIASASHEFFVSGKPNYLRYLLALIIVLIIIFFIFVRHKKKNGMKK